MGTSPDEQSGESSSGPGVSAPPDATDPRPARARRFGRAARGQHLRQRPRRRRRRRILIALIASPLLVVLSWASVSYTTWMLRPTSMSWSVDSVEWVRYKVPYGNWLADHIEQAYYSHNAPKKGGPQLKSLPAVGLIPPRISPRGIGTPDDIARSLAAAHHSGLPDSASR